MNILYFTNGKGKWIKRTYKKQCKARVWLTDGCQGVKGHEGEHWAYSNNGSYCYTTVKGMKNHLKGIGGGMIPPEHKTYINPKSKIKDYFALHFEDQEITSKKLIKRLEAGILKPGEAINEPVNDIA